MLWAGSLSLVTIFDKQLEYGWFIFSPPGLLAFVILLIANIAEVNRTPFDLPEAESEIIAGYHTEYSGMRFGLFFLAEYLSVFGVSCLGTVLFLGGGRCRSPFSEFPVEHPRIRLVVVLSWSTRSCCRSSRRRCVGFVFLMFWIRATLPRMRVDRLMNFAWKYLVPMSIVNILIAAVWYELVLRPGPAVLRLGVAARRPGQLADRLAGDRARSCCFLVWFVVWFNRPSPLGGRRGAVGHARRRTVATAIAAR